MLNLRTAAVVLAVGTLTYAARPLLQGMEMPKPTQQHIELLQSVGEWEGTVTMHMPGMEPQEYAATETVRSAGPFWIISDFKSTWMDFPYEGHGTHGYDPTKGKFVSTWIDNASSYLHIMEGEEKDGVMVMQWDAPDMMGQMAPHRSEAKHSEDAYSMTFYTSDAKTMVIDMKRTSAKAANASAKKQAR